MKKNAIIRLILKYIGGTPLTPATRTVVEGSATLRQMSLPGGLMGLVGMSGILDGIPIDGVLGNIVQNPLSSVTDLASSTLGDVAADLTSQLSSVLPTQLTEITGSITDLSSSISSLASHTDLMSGLSLPSYETIGQFGLHDMTSVISGVDQLTKALPDSLGSFKTELLTKLETHVQDITAPLSMADRVSEINQSIQTIKGELVAAAGTAAYDALHTAAVDKINGYKSEIDTVISNSTGAMARITEASHATALVSNTTSLINSDSPRVQALLKDVVQPAALKQLQNEANTPVEAITEKAIATVKSKLFN